MGFDRVGRYGFVRWNCQVLEVDALMDDELWEFAFAEQTRLRSREKVP